MVRLARIVVPGAPHHIVQRGNNRQDVFFVDDDRRAYLAILREQAKRHGLKVLGYCLMTNHVHIVAVPKYTHSLAKGIGRTNYDYTRYVNELHGRSGHLWQNRFYSCAMGDEHTFNALCYVERNPVRARMVRKPWRYPWSSARAHCDGTEPSGLLDLVAWHEMIAGLDWKAQLEAYDDEEDGAPLRRHTHTGRPLASDKFLAKLEKRFGRRVRARPVGRPKKPAKKAPKTHAKKKKK